MHHLTRFALARPRLTLALIALVTLVLGAGLPRLETEFGYRILLGEQHPSVQLLDELVKRYGGGLPLEIAWECGPGLPCNSVFDRASLEMARDLTAALEALPDIADVTSPANAPLLVPAEGGFAVRRFVENGQAVTDAPELSSRSLGDPLWLGTLLSPDARIGVILVQPRHNTSESDVRLVDGVERVLAPFEALGFRFHLVGESIQTVIPGRDLARSTARLLPFTILVVGIVLFWLCRSFAVVVSSLASIGVALVWTFGLLGWIGWPQDGIHEVLAPLILVIGACDSLRLTARFLEEFADDRGTPLTSETAMLRAAEDVGYPCLVMTMTTAGAFLSFATSSLGTFVRFGVISAAGVLFCLITTFLLLPLIAQRISPRIAAPQRTSAQWRAVLRTVVLTSERRGRLIVATSAVLLVFCAVGWATRLRVDTDWFESFGEHSQVTQWVRFIEERLGPSESLQIDVALPEGGDLTDPQVLRRVEEFSTFLEAQEGVGKTTSIVTILSRLNRLLHADDASFEHPADTPEANAELLELVTMEDADFLERWMTFDRSHLRISAETPWQPFSAKVVALDAIQAYIDRDIPSDWTVSLTGDFAINRDWIRDVQATQLRSFPSALLWVFLMISIFLRSSVLGLAAIVPAVLPVVVTLGAMGWLGMSLDVGRAMIGSIVLGIADDDSIHLLAHYKQRRKAGDNPRSAIESAVLHSGRAVVTTSVALALGFLTLMASAWQTISSFGFFVALAILGALVAVLFVLPALIFVFAPGQTEAMPRHESASRSRRPVKRWIIGSLVLMPVISSIVGVSFDAARETGRVELACWVLPNALVAFVPGTDACPVRPNSRIRRVQTSDGHWVTTTNLDEVRAALPRHVPSARLTVLEGKEEREVEVPVRQVPPAVRAARILSAGVISLGFMILPLLLLRSSRSPAALPFALFYSAVSVLVIVGVAGRESGWLLRGAAAAMLAAPAALVHLDLTFLRGGRLVRDAPMLAMLPYGIAAALFPPAWIALSRDALLWPVVTYVVLAAVLGALAILLLSCLHAVRDARSSLERSRTRLLLFGAPVLPLLLTAFMVSPGMRLSEIVGTYLWALTVFMPLPLGLAISRYNLFALASEARHWIGRAVYIGAAAAILAMVLSVSAAVVGDGSSLLHPAILYSLCVAAVVALEPLRGRMVGFLESTFSSRLLELRRLREDYFQESRALRNEDEVARLLGETLRKSLTPRTGCVFLLRGIELRPACSFGANPPASIHLARQARSLLGEQRIVQVGLQSAEEPPTERVLLDEGVELVALLESGGQELGLLLLGSSHQDAPYTGSELDFLAAVATYAAVALRNARVAEELLALERHATTGRVALALAHDVRKEIDWMRRLLKRMPDRVGDAGGLMRDVTMLQDFTEGLSEVIQKFVREAKRAGVEGPGSLLVETIVERTRRSMERIHGGGRISASVSPELRGVQLHEHAERVLANLLDNALRACPEGETVHVAVMSEDGAVRLSVIDGGAGMSEEVRARAFDLGFTTRAQEGGSGVGLAVSREIVLALGGTIELAAEAGRGTRATVVIPTAKPSEEPSDID